MKLEGADALGLGPAPQALPDSTEIPRTNRRTHIRTEHPIGSLFPSSSEYLPASEGQQLKQLGGKRFCHVNRSAPAALRSCQLGYCDCAADQYFPSIKVDVSPLQSEQFASPDSCGKKEEQGRVKGWFVLPSEIQKPGHLFSRPNGDFLHLVYVVKEIWTKDGLS